MSLSLIEGIVNSPYCTSTLIQFNSNKTFVQRQVMSDCILQDRGLHHNDIIVIITVLWIKVVKGYCLVIQLAYKHINILSEL